MAKGSYIDRIAKMAETQSGKESLSGRLLWKLGGVVSYQAVRYIGWVLVGVIILAVLFWDPVVLPFYRIVAFPVTFVPFLSFLLTFFTIYLVFQQIRRKGQDPVRRNANSFIRALSIIFLLNLAGLIFFSKAWEFYSYRVRWVSILLILSNFVFCLVLLFIFLMGWNRNDELRRKLFKHHVNKIYLPANPWHQLPHAIRRMEMTGWRKGSSFGINALYTEFLSQYRNAVDLLTQARLQMVLEETEQTATAVTQLRKETEKSLRAGLALARYCVFFEDLNGNHQLLSQEFYWRMLNIKMLQIDLMREGQDPVDPEIEDLLRILKWCQEATQWQKETAEEEEDLEVVGVWMAMEDFREEILRHRIYHWYLELRAPEFLQQETLTINRPLPSPELMTRLEEQIPALGLLREKVDAHLQSGSLFLNKMHFQRELCTETELSAVAGVYLSTLQRLKAMNPEEPDGMDAPVEDIRRWKGIPYHINGVDGNDIQSDVTHLLTITPVVQPEDKEETFIEFPTFWAGAAQIWVLKDLVYFERDISPVYFMELIRGIKTEKFPRIIHSEIKRLLKTKIAKRRWNEHNWIVGHRSGDHFQAFRHSLEELGEG